MKRKNWYFTPDSPDTHNDLQNQVSRDQQLTCLVRRKIRAIMYNKLLSMYSGGFEIILNTNAKVYKVIYCARLEVLAD